MTHNKLDLCGNYRLFDTRALQALGDYDYLAVMHTVLSYHLLCPINAALNYNIRKPVT